jgi:hypothetical protein
MLASGTQDRRFDQKQYEGNQSLECSPAGQIFPADMSIEVITFKKSFQERLSEYEDIVVGRGPLSACDIHNEWYFYIENLLEPAGWQAVWKIS